MLRTGTWLPAAVLVCAASGAFAEGVSFTADAVQKHPQQGTEQGKLFASDVGMRMERSQQGQQAIQISLPQEGVMRVLFPDKQTYVEMRGGAGPGSGIKPDNPCMGLSGDRCQNLGTDTLGSVKTEKWRISADQSQGPVTLWWDPERKIAVRQQFPDGSSMQMAMTGETTWEGRKVEKWEMTSISAKGEQQKAEQLFDRELNIAVREVFPNGVSRELKNIKVVKADPAWFEVPKGYRQQELPQAPQGQAPQGQMPSGMSGMQGQPGGYPPQGYLQREGQPPRPAVPGQQGYPQPGTYPPGYPPQYQGGQPGFRR
ncbi:MAG: hypothetical protein H7841_10945 [Magnetospirillum sp. WYHS-4]